MRNLLLNLFTKTTTNIDSLEQSSFSSIDDMLEMISSKKEATHVYVLDLSSDNWLCIVRQLEDNNFRYIKTDSNEKLENETYKVLCTYNVHNINRISFKKYHKTVTIYDGSAILGQQNKAHRIAKTMNESNEDKAVAITLKGLLAKGLNNSTVSAWAFSDMKRRCFASDKDKSGHNVFRFTFPEVDERYDKMARAAFSGGVCFVKEEYKNVDIKQWGKVYDVNSLYPSIMKEEALPYGYPVEFKGQYTGDFLRDIYIQKIMITSMRLKEDGVACIKRQSDEDYLCNDRSEELINVVLTLTNVDLELLFDNYECINVKYMGGIKFCSEVGMFDNFINHWVKEKEEATETNDKVRRLVSKLMLNGCYGKFAARTDQFAADIEVVDDMIVKVASDKKTSNMVYTAMGSFIASYARKRLIEAVKANYDRFAYCDTDSIHLIGMDKAKGIKIHKSDLGAWKLEAIFIEAKFLNKKQYAEKLVDGSLKVTVSGMLEEMAKQITSMDQFQYGLYLEQEYEFIDEYAIVETGIVTYTLTDDLIFSSNLDY